MKITNSFNIDFGRNTVPPHLVVMQKDSMRQINVSLYENGQAWNVPADSSAYVAFTRPNGDNVKVTTLSNGNPIATFSNNLVTVAIPPELTDVSGNIPVVIVFIDKNALQIATFPISVSVLESPSAVGKEVDPITPDQFDQLMSALSIERSRISNLATLTDGSTTGDAELADIRTAFDGNIYENAGESVRNQANIFNKLYSNLPISWVGESYIYGKDGTVIEKEDYYRTDYIDVSAFCGCYLLVKCRHKENAGYAFYDGSYSYVFGDCPSMKNDYETNSVKYEKIFVPENVSYVRISAKGQEDLYICGVCVSQATEETFEKIFPTLPISWTNGYYINGKYGVEIEYSDYSYTDYVDISAYRGCSLLVKYRHFSDVGYAIYNEGKEYISGDSPTVSGDVNSDKLRIVTITIPENASFIRISARTATDIEDCYVRLYPSVEEMCKRDKKEDNEFLKYLQRKVICIGDSLTHGAYYGEGYDGAGISENYPYFLSKMTGWNVTEAGDSGYAPKGWYVYSLPKYNFADYDTALIWLGTNKGLTDTLEEDTASGNRDTYADTETAYYCKIIERIVEQNPNIRIFLGTVFRVTGSTRAITNSVINQIAEKYSENVIGVVDNNKGNLFGGDRQDILHPFGNTTHFGKVGNAYVAKNWLDEISRIISEKPTDFEKLLPVSYDNVGGVVFVPSVSNEGVISWTNNGNLPNPEPVNIKGKEGENGRTPVKGTDYWTEFDKAEMVNDVIASLPVYNGEVVE